MCKRIKTRQEFKEALDNNKQVALMVDDMGEHYLCVDFPTDAHVLQYVGSTAELLHVFHLITDMHK